MRKEKKKQIILKLMKKRLDLTEAKGDFANQINLIISMP